MRDDHKTALKQIKQQLNAFCLRHGHHYDKTKWTGLHLNWLRKLELSKVQRETVEEYLATYETLTSKIAAIGLVPGECSSGNTERMLGITKAGNSI